MEFRVLGPLEVIGPGGPIEIPSARQRAILALLVLNLGETVPRERLIDEIWGDDPPPTAQHALGVHVAGLRRALGPNTLETQPRGYRLRGSGTQVDLQRFDALLQEGSEASLAGDPRAAAARFRAALALWRGPALADLGEEHAARSQRARLDELRFAATERWLDAELASGRHLDVIPDLRRIVAEVPLREGFATRLMLALYRSGRQAEALAVYHEARDVLQRELGVEPGPELESLQAAILAHDSALQPLARTEPARPAEALPPSDQTPDREVQVAAPRQQPRVSRRTVTELSARLAGQGGGRGILDPESTRRPPAQVFEELIRIAHRHGGTAQRVSDGAVVAVFGRTTLHEDDPLRAVRAASEMQAAVRARNDDIESGSGAPIELRISVATGEVLTGNAEGGTPYPDLGRLAAAEVAAGPGDVLLDESTYRLVRWAVEADAITTIEKLGASERLKAYRLVEVTASLGGRGRTFDTPLVGRERELQLLAAAFEQVTIDQSCAMFTLLGPAGVGKSRLVHEFIRGVRPEALILRGRCLPYGEQAAYWPVAEIVRQAAGIEDADAASVVRERIEALLKGDQRADVIADLVASAIGSVGATSTAEGVFWAIRSLLDGLAASGRPVVLIFDDVQWGESTFLDLIEYIAETSKDVPILLLCVTRPELLDERPGWGGGKLNAASVLLKPLTNAEASQLVTNLLGGTAASAAVQAKIVDGAEGNPLFVEEFLAMLLEDGVVHREAGIWVAATDLGTVTTPPSIMALLKARLDRLPANEREVLDRASVVGKVFGRDAVEALDIGRDPIELEPCLRSLVRRELIRADGPSTSAGESYRFKHILIRDAAYAGLPKRERIALHERLADWLARSAEGESSLYDEVIGAHLEVAYRYRIELGPADERVRGVGQLAAARLGAAGRRAQVRGDAAAAENLLDRAVALLPQEDPERLAMLVDLTRVKITRGDFEAAKQINGELVREARHLGFEALLWRGTLDAFGFDFPPPQGQAERRRGEIEAAIQFFASSGDNRQTGRAWWSLGNFEYVEGHADAARLAHRRAAEYAHGAGDVHGQSLAMIEGVCAEMEGPAPVTAAMRTAHELISWARESGQLGTEGIALAVLGRLEAMVGQIDEARRLVREGIAIGSQLGRAYHEAADNGRWIGLVEWLAGDYVAAELGLRQGYEALLRIGAPQAAGYTAPELARMLFLLARYEEAEQFVQIAETREMRMGAGFLIQLNGVRGLVLAHRGQTEEAIASARNAVAIGRASDLHLWSGRAIEDLAEVLLVSGHVEEAAPLFNEAIAVYEGKGITILAERARDRLRGLRSGAHSI